MYLHVCSGVVCGTAVCEFEITRTPLPKLSTCKQDSQDDLLWFEFSRAQSKGTCSSPGVILVSAATTPSSLWGEAIALLAELARPRLVTGDGVPDKDDRLRFLGSILVVWGLLVCSCLRGRACLATPVGETGGDERHSRASIKPDCRMI